MVPRGTFKVVPQTLPGHQIPGGRPHITMAQPLLDASNRRSVGVAERGEGVSQKVRGYFGGYACKFTSPAYYPFKVIGGHWDPAPAMADKEIIPTWVTRLDRDKAPVLKPVSKIGPGSSPQGNLPLFCSLTTPDENAPFVQINILQTNIDRLAYSEAGVQHQAKGRQVSNLSPAPMSVRFRLCADNPFHFFFKMSRKLFEVDRQGRAGEASRPAGCANFIQGIVGNEPALKAKVDEISQDAVVSVDCIGFIVLAVFDKSRDAFRRWRPLRAYLPVNIQDAPVLAQSTLVYSPSSQEEASYSAA